MPYKDPTKAAACRVRAKRKARTIAKGWTPERVENAKIEQGGRCAICNEVPKEMPKSGGAGGLIPDHTHTEPPVPRKLLCHCCNVGLGFFNDSPELLETAADYLRKFS